MIGTFHTYTLQYVSNWPETGRSLLVNRGSVPNDALSPDLIEVREFEALNKADAMRLAAQQAERMPARFNVKAIWNYS